MIPPWTSIINPWSQWQRCSLPQSIACTNKAGQKRAQTRQEEEAIRSFVSHCLSIFPFWTTTTNNQQQQQRADFALVRQSHCCSFSVERGPQQHSSTHPESEKRASSFHTLSHTLLTSLFHPSQSVTCCLFRRRRRRGIRAQNKAARSIMRT